jgi:hypothetical protein
MDTTDFEETIVEITAATINRTIVTTPRRIDHGTDTGTHTTIRITTNIIPHTIMVTGVILVPIMPASTFDSDPYSNRTFMLA